MGTKKSVHIWYGQELDIQTIWNETLGWKYLAEILSTAHSEVIG